MHAQSAKERVSFICGAALLGALSCVLQAGRQAWRHGCMHAQPHYPAAPDSLRLPGKRREGVSAPGAYKAEMYLM